MRRNAFTLLELLVVVTVIVVLTAMLIPALEDAMVAGQRARCVTNVRGQYIALTQYASDNEGLFVPGATMGDSPDYHRTWNSSYPGFPPYDRVTRMRGTYLPDGEVMYCPITAVFGNLYRSKNDVDNVNGFGAWNTDQAIIITPYMWLVGFDVVIYKPMTMLNNDPVPPKRVGESSARHTLVTHRLDYYKNPGTGTIEVQDVGHFGAGWFRSASPYDSHKTAESVVGVGDGSVFVRSRDEMDARMVIGGTNPPDPTNPGMPGVYFW